MQTQQQEMEEANTAVSSHANTGRNAPEEGLESHDTLRVTPEEVALAAAALEAKRDAEYTWHETSLPLDEAIHYLGLNATPQDLAPEVVALREERSKRTAQAKQSQTNKRVGIGAGIGALMAIGLFVWIVRQPLNLPSKTLPIQKLAAIPDNVTVHIDTDTLLKLAKNEITPSEVSVDVRPTNDEEADYSRAFANEWRIVKSNGVVLVKGWASVEFALNISNNSTGALFSARPEWIAFDNVIPIQVPVYRLEDQSVARYLLDGKEADRASKSDLVGMNVADTPKAIQDLIHNDILKSDQKFADSNMGWNEVTVNVKNSGVHLTGTVTEAALKNLAGEVAAGTLKRLQLSYPFSNELTVEKKPE